MADRAPNRVSKAKGGASSYKKSKGGAAYKVAFEAGDAGVIVSCDMGREGKCAGEILDLFTEYHEKSLGRQTHQRDLEGSNDQGEDDDNQGDNSDPGDDDIETQIKKEMASLKPSSSKPRLFQRVTSSMPCIVLYRIDKSIDPVKLVHDICVDARANLDERKSRWIRRMTPVTQVRKVLSVDVEAFTKEIVNPYFNADDTPKTYAIRPTIRRNNTIDRDSLIKTVAAAVGSGHKVDLTNPDYTIIVEVAQNVIGMSVVGCDYDELKRFNLMEIYSPTRKPQPVLES